MFNFRKTPVKVVKQVLFFFHKLLLFLFLFLIKAYQYLISPFTSPSCRHIPTCSNYAYEALKVHGLLKGGWLAVKRLSRCHPLGTWGYDPVPPKKQKNKKV